MSYTAIARKWRPRRFAELVGQEHVLRALANALDQGRVHHAFLFTGTRGVGKTTIARILAKSLNCEKGVTSNPCGKCSACREVDSGRFVDLIEVDAASRTKVDDTRELLDNVQYAPTRGRYKVYLIDEVHMLSTSSFNALLKTLEEPPPHVKFLLATTDPQKVPVTVLSRCLQFNLKRLPVALIVGRMQHILEQEKIAFEAPALKLLAYAADGSLRDGLSLLDQLIAFGGGAVGEAAARAMLGSIDREHTANLGRELAVGDAARLIAVARTLEEFSPDYAQVLADLAALLERVALRQAVPSAEFDDQFDGELIADLAQRIPPEDVQLYYQTAILGRRDLALAPDPRTGFEMTLLRMLAFRPAGGSADRAPAAVTAVPANAASNVKAATHTSSQRPLTTVAAPASGTSGALSVDSWLQVVAALDVGGAARQLAQNCGFITETANVVTLALDPRNSHMATAAQQERLAQALGAYLGRSVRIEFTQAAPETPTASRARERAEGERFEHARKSLDADPTVQAIKERFGATLLEDSVRPAKP